MWKFLKPVFFVLPPEQAHRTAMQLLRILFWLPGIGRWLKSWSLREGSDLACEAFGLSFRNPIGLAAGFDKDGEYIWEIAALGFGFMEVGTVTPRPQSGNPKPRLFRLVADEALINRMGFNNSGVDQLAARLAKGRPPGFVIGGNIGKNKDTPNEEALKDYLYCFEKLFPFVDYFVVNVSSPNTPNLRDLQAREPLTALLSGIEARNKRMHARKPILLKIAPDLSESALLEIIEIIGLTGIDGIVATNTTIERRNLVTKSDRIAGIGAGGLSGRPLKERSTEIVRFLEAQTNGQLSIIGVGGISNGSDVMEMMEAGASLVQLYTGFVYQGPTIVYNICKFLHRGR